MKKQIINLMLSAAIVTTSSLWAVPMDNQEPEFLRKRREMVKRSGEEIVTAAAKNREVQKKEVAAHQEKKRVEENFKAWTTALRIDRFPHKQNKLKKMIQEAIVAFERESKISHVDLNQHLAQLSSIPTYKRLKAKLLKTGENQLLNQQIKRKVDADIQNAPLRTVREKYKYDRDKLVFLSESRDSYLKKNGNYFDLPMAINDVYKSLGIDQQSPASKKHGETARIAREKVTAFIKHDRTGVVFLPTTTDGKVNALVKVLRPHHQIGYLFYNSRRLPSGLTEDPRYTHLERDYTIITLDHAHKILLFAVSHKGPEEPIFPLTTRQDLPGAEMSQVHALAEAVWNKRILQTKQAPAKLPEKTVVALEAPKKPVAPVQSRVIVAAPTQPKTGAIQVKRAASHVQKAPLNKSAKVANKPETRKKPEAPVQSRVKVAGPTQPKTGVIQVKRAVSHVQKAPLNKSAKVTNEPETRKKPEAPVQSRVKVAGPAQPKTEAIQVKRAVSHVQKAPSNKSAKIANKPEARKKPGAPVQNRVKVAAPTQPKIKAIHAKRVVSRVQKALLNKSAKVANKPETRKKPGARVQNRLKVAAPTQPKIKAIQAKRVVSRVQKALLNKSAKLPNKPETRKKPGARVQNRVKVTGPTQPKGRAIRLKKRTAMRQPISAKKITWREARKASFRKKSL